MEYIGNNGGFWIHYKLIECKRYVCNSLYFFRLESWFMIIEAAVEIEIKKQLLKKNIGAIMEKKY